MGYRRRGWDVGDADFRPTRTDVSSLRHKLGDDANNPTYILNEPRVGYRMEKGETAEPETGP